MNITDAYKSTCRSIYDVTCNDKVTVLGYSSRYPDKKMDAELLRRSKFNIHYIRKCTRTTCKNICHNGRRYFEIGQVATFESFGSEYLSGPSCHLILGDIDGKPFKETIV